MCSILTDPFKCVLDSNNFNRDQTEKGKQNWNGNCGISGKSEYLLRIGIDTQCYRQRRTASRAEGFPSARAASAFFFLSKDDKDKDDYTVEAYEFESDVDFLTKEEAESLQTKAWRRDGGVN
ncbi:hypothetical protein L2E82_13128 [Cichorium intybus]|uniref:Uncharacterized protein n=1 Tax=Cichorium intybus TaxID=13427 RepID=A0ACB9GIM1_CICIN|nr:hypothetical protein L2E82_13128 [Cichorium intybus]